MKEIKLNTAITRRDCDSLDKYLSDISREHLLTMDEEIELVKRIRQNDPMAKEHLVRANLRFVVSVAKHYQNGQLPLSDLINEGNIGLMKAAERFDETRGFKFISYAVWWIRQSILAALSEQSRLIKVPTNKISSMSKIRKAIDRWEQKHERLPTSIELAEILELDEEQIEETMNSFVREASLDTPIGLKDDSTLLDIIPNTQGDEDKDSPFQSELFRKELGRLLGSLASREREVIEMTFGINCPHSYSLEEVGEAFCISRERVRQIKDKAMKKLSFSPLRKQLRTLYV